MTCDKPSDGRYGEGCRCDGCKAAHAAQGRKTRAKDPVARTRRAKPKTNSGNVIQITGKGTPKGETPSAPALPGAVELATREQCESAPLAWKKPAIVALAIKLAQQLDNEKDYGAMTHQFAARLESLLAQLEGPRKKSGGRLVRVQAMGGNSSARQAK